MKRKLRAARLLAASLLAVSLWSGNPAAGACQDVMFLLDTSQSMTDSDAMRMAPDSVRAMLFSLNPGDRAGVIAFGTEPTVLRPLSPVQTGTPPDFSGLRYEGYTNTGAAVTEALRSLEESRDPRRSVVIVTDGEIMMPDAEETLHSAQRFAEGMERASREGIPVYILSIQNGPDDKDYRLYTGYAKGESVPVGQLLMKSRELARKELHACSMELPLRRETNAGGSITGLAADLPLPQTERMRVRILSSQPGRVAIAGHPLQQAGRVQELQFVSPPGERPAFLADYPPGTELVLDAVPEVDGVLRLAVDARWHDDSVTVRVTPTGRDEKESLLLADECFEGKPVHLRVNGQEVEGIVRNGVISVEIPRPEDDTVLAEDVRFEELGFHFLGTNMARERVSQRGLLPCLFAVLGVAVLLLLVQRRRGRAHLPASAPMAVDGSPGGSYRGKLVVHVTKTPDGSDIPLLEYNLFRRSGNGELTLEDVLRGCGVMMGFPGAGDIVIGPLNHGIYIENRSDCTITKRGDILLRNGRVGLSFDESIHIAFSDEKSEMIVTYKSLKPRERMTEL